MFYKQEIITTQLFYIALTMIISNKLKSLNNKKEIQKL